MSNLSSKIAIHAQTLFLPERSTPEENQYAFSYTITIRNQGSEPARLLRRKWTIFSDNGRRQEVEGDGVVGEQPRLEPGQGFSYTSWAMLETPTGQMQGRYFFIADCGAGFWADVPTFFFEEPGARVVH